MTLLPQSIQAVNTNALDATFLERLNSIGVKQLLIDLEHERDLTKLSLWLTQFGIPIALLPDNFNEIQFRSLLQNILHIYRLSGTVKSIKMLATAIGATEAQVIRNTFKLDYYRQSIHNRAYKYNKGAEFSKFAIDIVISGVTVSMQPNYTVALNELFNTFQPANIYLRKITFN